MQTFLTHNELKYKTVLIWSGEWEAWWRPDGQGYTQDREQAGRFWYEDAIKRTQHCDPSKKISFWLAQKGEQGITLEVALSALQTVPT